MQEEHGRVPLSGPEQAAAGEPRTQAPAATPAPPDLLPADTKPPGAELHRPRADGGAGGKRLQQLKKLLASGNRRFEAVAVVIQHVVAEREEAEKQKRELSQELLALRGELAPSSPSLSLSRTVPRHSSPKVSAPHFVTLEWVHQPNESRLADYPGAR
ncbi:hypothetical protein ANANG_G00134250 [Anguilla anguilla]|uniref:Uncharacterized protein n=1 Tax=Anguilla anguilla TaxID=7936 RepID=A0A9D3M9L8_ANGAN|nr:hypothetical protein ANANG_G00134250 [Anguilla anguilla]